jgi:hypothetical protein
LKAFSIGSCKNMCGKQLPDCSCLASCSQIGNCCSDYRECELLLRNPEKSQSCVAKKLNCEMCSNENDCVQCKPGLYLKNGDCTQQCELDDKVFKENMLCIKNQRCLVDNCIECESGNPSVCKQCINGFFLHNNMCHLNCPGSFRADRMNWMCMDPAVFSWYWVFPSKSTCRNRCGLTIENTTDCSCREDCIRYGNCCQDIEEYCYKFV